MNLDRVIAVRNSKTVYRDGNLCVKVFDSDYSKADVLNEALNQARVEECGLNIPKIKEVMTIDGKWAIVSEYIKGKTLAHMIEEEPEKADACLKMLTELQIRTHAAVCPLLNKFKDKAARKIISSDLDATTRYDICTRLENMPRHNKLCHGDFTPANIIISKDGEPYITDWSHATQGNASADAAATYLSFILAGENDAAEKYLRMFCHFSETDEKYVRRFVPIVAAMNYDRAGSAHRAVLIKLINLVDYE